MSASFGGESNGGWSVVRRVQRVARGRDILKDSWSLEVQVFPEAIVQFSRDAIVVPESQPSIVLAGAGSVGRGGRKPV
jgi:hypothetical protein